jgi:hypothetical protein
LTLIPFASSVVQIELDKIKEDALQAVDDILEMETIPIHTQNTDLFASETQKWRSFYTTVRQNASPATDTSESESNHDQDDLAEITDDKFQQALSVMVDVRSYFQVAYQVTFSKGSFSHDLLKINVHFI